jgi:hypothetical protein
MYKDIKVRVKGVSPLMLHNSRLANPLDPITKEMKRVSGKRGKTDADLELLANLEWLGGLYTSEGGKFEINGSGLKIDGFGVPCIPGEVIEGAMLVAARKHKLGKQFSAGLLCDGNWPIEYNGPKAVAALSKDDGFKDMRIVKIQNRSIMRCRPIFNQWQLEFVLSYLPSLLNEQQVRDVVELAGQVAAIGDYRPKYGRFEVL